MDYKALARGSKTELEKAYAAATPAEKGELEKAVAEFKAETISEITISGRAGGVFNINGSGFGDSDGKPRFVPRGVVTLNGHPVEITRWNDTSIKGFLPDDATDGEVEIRVDGKLLKTYFGKVKK